MYIYASTLPQRNAHTLSTDPEAADYAKKMISTFIDSGVLKPICIRDNGIPGLVVPLHVTRSGSDMKLRMLKDMQGMGFGSNI